MCKSGATVSDLPFKVKGFAGEFCNVEGVINANEEQEEWIVSAHYDTVCNSPGADDNASGVAVMLEAARVLALSDTRRTIRFIGFKAQRFPPGLDLAPFKKHDVDQDRMCGNFIAILSEKVSQRLGDVCFNQCCAVDLPAIFADMPLDVCKIRKCFPNMARADHIPFWEQRIPAITLTDTANLRTPYYHTENDTADKLDMGFAAKVCRATVRTVLQA